MKYKFKNFNNNLKIKKNKFNYLIFLTFTNFLTWKINLRN